MRKSIFACVLLAAGVAFWPAPPFTMEAQAAQPWYCMCKGAKKRFLASTRHCESHFKIAKGKWCTKDQLREVYGPACAKKGCTVSL